MHGHAWEHEVFLEQNAKVSHGNVTGFAKRGLVGTIINI